MLSVEDTIDNALLNIKNTRLFFGFPPTTSFLVRGRKRKRKREARTEEE